MKRSKKIDVIAFVVVLTIVVGTIIYVIVSGMNPSL